MSAPRKLGGQAIDDNEVTSIATCICAGVGTAFEYDSVNPKCFSDFPDGPLGLHKPKVASQVLSDTFETAALFKRE